MRKYFTIEEAEKALPKMEDFLEKLQKIKNQINLLQIEHEQFHQTIQPTNEEGAQFFNEQEVKMLKEIYKLHYEFYSTLENFNTTGAVLKDIDEGLIDFRHKSFGKEVFLCWKQGETKIEHWHKTDNGYNNRQKIMDLQQ